MKKATVSEVIIKCDLSFTLWVHMEETYLFSYRWCLMSTRIGEAFVLTDKKLLSQGILDLIEAQNLSCRLIFLSYPSIFLGGFLNKNLYSKFVPLCHIIYNSPFLSYSCVTGIQDICPLGSYAPMSYPKSDN